MKKILTIILWVIFSLWLATFSYAMVFNSYLNDDWVNQTIEVPSTKSIVFSLSKKIDEINFSKDSGFTIRTLEWWKWIDMTDNVDDYQPMKWYMVRNISEWNLKITMKLKNISSINDTIFQKTLKAGWNLVWPAYKNDNAWIVENMDAFGNSNYSHIADFTWNGFITSWEARIAKQTISWEVQITEENKTFADATVRDNQFQIKNKNELANVKFLEWMAYAVFVSNDTVIPGSQNITTNENNKENIDDFLEDLFWGWNTQTGTLDFIYDSEIKILFNDRKLLSGEKEQVIYNFWLKVWDKNTSIEKIEFKIKDSDFSNNFKNINLYNNENMISDNSSIRFESNNTYITFEEIELTKNTNYSNLKIVSDLEKYSSKWEDINIQLWSTSIWFNSMNWDFTGEVRNSKWEIISDYSVTNENLTITPSLVNLSTINKLGNENIAKIRLNIEEWNNILWDNKIKIKRISSEAIISSVKNNNKEKLISREWIISNLTEFEINDWDEIEIKVDWFDWDDIPNRKWFSPFSILFFTTRIYNEY